MMNAMDPRVSLCNWLHSWLHEVDTSWRNSSLEGNRWRQNKKTPARIGGRCMQIISHFHV